MFPPSSTYESQVSQSSSLFSRYQTNGVKFAFGKNPRSVIRSTLSPSNSCEAIVRTKNLEVRNSGLRVFSVPVRRVRGLTAALNKLDPFPFIFETVGPIVECETSSDCCVIKFLLEEQTERSHGVQLKCRFEDMDENRPAISNGQIYRCVGKFSMHHNIFQCYSITPCNEADLQLIEIFQMHSDNVIAQILLQN